MRVFIFFISIAILSPTVFAQQQISIDIAGKYANMSESSFVYTLDLAKDGKATYREPDPEGGKALVLRGKWTLVESVLTVNFGKEGRYVYTPQAKLSWESFGCRAATLGLQIKSTPRGQTNDAAYHVWRSADLKGADRCKRI